MGQLKKKRKDKIYINLKKIEVGVLYLLITFLVIYGAMWLILTKVNEHYLASVK